MAANFYRLRNTGRFGMWVTAPTEEEAIKYAMSIGFARKAENIKVIDQTERFVGRGADEIKASDVVGGVVWHGHSIRFDELVRGAKAAPPMWQTSSNFPVCKYCEERG